MSVTRRLRIRAGFQPGPLSRHVDRAEAWSQLVIMMIFAILILPATWSVAGAVGRAGVEQERAQQANRFQVTATLLQKAPLPASGAISSAFRTPVPAQWRTPQGTPHTGVVKATPGAVAGSTVTIWIEASGDPAPPPIRHQDTVASIFAAAFLVVVLTSGALLGIRALIHQRFERRRFEQWDQEWALVGPDWSPSR